MAPRSASVRRAPGVNQAAVPLGRRVILALGLIILASMAFSGLMMTRDHSWGDDFAAYVLQAKSIVQGDMPEYVAKSTFTMEESSHIFGPVTEPWGYPLLLSPVYALMGLSVQALKAVAVLCYAAFLLTFFLLARTRLKDSESLLLTAVLAFNVGMLGGTNEILSDIPFALWSTLSLWLMLRAPEAPVRSKAHLLRPALVGAALFAAVFTRVAGFTALPALGNDADPEHSRGETAWSALGRAAGLAADALCGVRRAVRAAGVDLPQRGARRSAGARNSSDVGAEPSRLLLGAGIFPARHRGRG